MLDSGLPALVLLVAVLRDRDLVDLVEARLAELPLFLLLVLRLGPVAAAAIARYRDLRLG